MARILAGDTVRLDVSFLPVMEGVVVEYDPVIQQLAGPGRLGAAGTFVLSPADPEALEEGRLYVQVYTKNETMGGRALPLAWPAP